MLMKVLVFIENEVKEMRFFKDFYKLPFYSQLKRDRVFNLYDRKLKYFNRLFKYIVNLLDDYTLWFNCKFYYKFMIYLIWWSYYYFLKKKRLFLKYWRKDYFYKLVYKKKSFIYYYLHKYHIIYLFDTGGKSQNLSKNYLKIFYFFFFFAFLKIYIYFLFCWGFNKYFIKRFHFFKHRLIMKFNLFLLFIKHYTIKKEIIFLGVDFIEFFKIYKLLNFS